jgi:hypothetical protein
MNSKAERRYPRVTCQTRATAGTASGEVRSFSKTGCFLATETQISPGSELELRFFLPDGTYLDAVGEVKRVIAGVRRGEPGLGIRFLRINSEALSAIERIAGETADS